MAKTPSVTLHDFFAGQAIEAFPEEKILAIYKKARELGSMPYDPGNGWPAKVHTLALVIADHAHKAAKAIDANDAMTAMLHGYKVGEYCQKISTLLAVKDSLNHQDKALEPRVAGGKERGQQTKEDAEETKQKIIKHWHRLKDKPEHNRAAIIAELMTVSPKTVRDHLSKAGLRKTNTS